MELRDKIENEVTMKWIPHRRRHPHLLWQINLIPHARVSMHMTWLSQLLALGFQTCPPF